MYQKRNFNEYFMSYKYLFKVLVADEQETFCGGVIHRTTALRSPKH